MVDFFPFFSIISDPFSFTLRKFTSGNICFYSNFTINGNCKLEIFERTYEPPRGKTNNVVYEQVRHKTELYTYKRWLEAGNFGVK